MGGSITTHGLLETLDAAELAGIAHRSWLDFGEDSTCGYRLWAGRHIICVRDSDETVCWCAADHFDFDVIAVIGLNADFLCVEILDFIVI